MTRKYTESEIRDIIADNLQCIEPGMVLIDTEHYLPNYKVTKGFVGKRLQRSSDGYRSKEK